LFFSRTVPSSAIFRGDSLDHVVQSGHRDLTVHDGGFQGLTKVLAIGHYAHFHVQAGVCSRSCGVGSPPVGLDEALEAPLLLEDVRKQFGVFAGLNAVDAVVGAHYGGGFAFLDRRLERGKIDFPQGSLVHVL
jgi:hypothetical protein